MENEGEQFNFRDDIHDMEKALTYMYRTKVYVIPMLIFFQCVADEMRCSARQHYTGEQFKNTI